MIGMMNWRGYWPSLPANLGSLGIAGLLSGILHAALLALPTAPRADPRQPLPLAARIEVRLLAPTILPPESAPSPTLLPPPDGQTSGAMLIADAQVLRDATAPGAPDPGPTMEAPRLALPDIAYHDLRELTLRPAPLVDIPLEPGALKTRKETGQLILRLWINEQGGVDRIAVERSELPPEYAAAASKAFLAARFQPGEIDGRPVKTLMRVAVDYAPLLIAPERLPPVATTPAIPSAAESSPPPPRHPGVAPDQPPAPASAPPRR
jgi:protein TonB